MNGATGGVSGVVMFVLSLSPLPRECTALSPPVLQVEGFSELA